MTPRRGSRIAAPMLFALALALAACTSARTYTFTLAPVPPARPVAARRALHPPIEVGEVGIPATIDRNSIVLTAPDDQLDVLPNSVWGAPLRELIRRTLSEDLHQRLPPGSVLPPGTPTPGSGLRIVAVEIQHFGGDTAGRVVLDAGWTVARSGHQPSGEPTQEHIAATAANGTASAVVPAMSEALAHLADRIARSLR